MLYHLIEPVPVELVKVCGGGGRLKGKKGDGRLRR